MNTFETIHSRKTVRSFNGKSISDHELKEILKAAYAAPVGRARYDTLSLSVITNNELLKKWEKTTSVMFGNPDMHPFYGAPTVILVSSLTDGDALNNVNYSNAATIVQNMALTATELGVGACHIWGAVAALGKDKELIKELGVEEGFLPCCAIALGQFDGKYEVREIPENRIKTQYIK